MIRKRDFILFVLILFFLVLGIGTTVIYERWQSSVRMVSDIKFSYLDRELNAVVPLVADDKESNLERLRQRLNSGERITKPAENIDVVPEIKPVDTASVSNRSINTCTTAVDDTSIKSTWPKSGLLVKEVEGARMVYQIIVKPPATTSSSTIPIVEEKPKLQLALNQLRGESDSCVAGSIIGITSTGGLILNSDANFYSAVMETTLIGYALDGFPIYGNKADVSTLDQCGGENTSLGYRYYLRSSEDFILGCFAGTPGTFIK